MAAVSSSRRAVSARVVWNPVVFPKRFVITGKVEIHLAEWFHRVLIRFDFHVSHLAQPVIHSLSSPVSIFMEEAAVPSENSTKRSIIRRDTRIIHQLLHHLLYHVHSSHRSRPAIDQQVVCHDVRTHLSVSLHLLEQVHCTIHVLRLDPALHECVVSTIIRSQSGRGDSEYLDSILRQV
jgi:hypothetical protein